MPSDAPTRVEVFADISCPFTHCGLKKVTALFDELDREVELIVRAWPLEWVNGEPLGADAVAIKSKALGEQLGVTYFDGFRPDRWPETTIPALNLVADAYEVDAATGLAVSLDLRTALFEEGRNVADPAVLVEIAGRHGLDAPATEASATVRTDYDEGKARGVRGSPDFWVGDDEFFCPSLSIGHDDQGALTAEFDPDGLREFIDRTTR